MRASPEPGRLVASVNAALRKHVDAIYRETLRDRFGVTVSDCLGVRMPAVHRVAGRHYREFRHLPVDQRFALCGALLATRVYEHRLVAFRWAHLARNDHRFEHLALFAGWLSEHVEAWSDCDDLCVHVIGELFLRVPERAPEVATWTRSRNRWMRRGAAVSLVLPVRRGKTLRLALEVADRLLDDREDLVRKAYGWLLKEAGRAHPEEVFGYLMKRREAMPRSAVRNAAAKLPEKLRREVMRRAG